MFAQEQADGRRVLQLAINSLVPALFRRGLNVDERCVVSVRPSSSASRRAAPGCGCVGAAELELMTGLCSVLRVCRERAGWTIAGVRGHRRPGVRGLMSRYGAKRSRPTATTPLEGSGTEEANLSIFPPERGYFAKYQAFNNRFAKLQSSLGAFRMI